MAFLSIQELVDLKKTNANAQIYNYGRAYPANEIDETVAKHIHQTCLSQTLAVQQGKVNRPWELINLTEKLDSKQAWFGFEFETGFNTHDDYKKIIQFVWDNIEHVAIDREGYGRYCPEITFSPQNMDKFFDKTADIYTVIKWMNENKVRMPDIGDFVGTHLNLSTPTYRAGTNRSTVCDLMNHSILLLKPEEQVELFGRVPYGLGNEMNVNGQAWIEFKMFRSTDDLEKFDGYMKVARRLARVMEKLSGMKLPMEVRGCTDFVDNFADILRGKAKVSAGLEIARTASFCIKSEGNTRGWRSRYGQKYNDRAMVKIAA
jgi:hypothetical protein